MKKKTGIGNSSMHLVHSPDENGWYWERFSDWKTSPIFLTKEQAINAQHTGELFEMVWQ